MRVSLVSPWMLTHTDVCQRKVKGPALGESTQPERRELVEAAVRQAGVALKEPLEE